MSHDVREVMVDGPSELRHLPGRAMPWYERSRRRLLWSNGSIAYAFSAEEPERLRGPQFEAAWARAEPIAALYEQGRVTHAGAFPALEEELLALGAAESEGLLDRADALVWALSALMLGPPPGEGPRIRLLGPELPPHRGLSAP